MRYCSIIDWNSHWKWYIMNSAIDKRFRCQNMEGTCKGKGITFGINLIIDLFGCKTQQITILIQYKVATYVAFTYNTTSTPNISLSHQFICTHNYPFFCIKLIHLLNLFQSQCIFYTYCFHISLL